MRAMLAVVVLLLALAAVVFLTWDDGSGVPAPPGGGGDGNGASTLNGQGARATGLPEGVAATRTVVVDPEAQNLADRPSVCLKFVDYKTGKPLAGAMVRSMVNGADLAFSDERGLASVPLKKPAQLPVVLDGYLLRLAPARLGTNEQEPQVIQMVWDQWSLNRRLAFADPDGRALTDVFVRIRPAGDAPKLRAPVPDGDAILRRAWSEHTRLASHVASRDVAVQLGSYSADRVHRLQGEVSAVRFLAPANYVLEAATPSGFVARANIAVIPGSEPPAQRVVMQPGSIVSGVVSDLTGRPLANAEIAVQGGEPLGLRASTTADGEFAIGPLLEGSCTLLARHSLHEAIAHGPVSIPSSNVEIKLRALHRTPLRGCVRVRPGLEPLAGAAVIWQVPQGKSIVARTAADGTFELMTAGDIAAKLIVQAAEHVTYAELVDPGQAFANYDVWPADLPTRLAKGITASLTGVVFDAAGKPAVNAVVRWLPTTKTAAASLPSRRILEGAVLMLPGIAATDPSGAFVVETNQFGSGTIVLTADTSNSVSATATAGKSTQGLELHQ